MDDDNVTITRLRYFRLMTGREPSDLERLQNTGFIEISKRELENLQKHNREDKADV